MFPLIAEELRKRYPDVEIAPFELFGNIHGKGGNEILARLPQRLLEEGVDAAVVGVGNCGSCTPAVMRGVMLAEQAGLPSVALVSSGFHAQAKAVARALGIEGAPIAVYPGVIPFDTRQELEQKIAEAVLPAVLEGFAKPLSEVAGGGTADATRAPLFSGTYDEVQEHFHANGWSDGLPVTPPTPARVQEFLSFVERDPDEVIKRLIEEESITLEALTYIRGRSIPNQYLIVDEAQNLTPHEIKTIVTRVGEGTKIILTGDPYQIDNPYVDSSSNGLSFLVERFKGEKIAAHVTLSKGERSELAELAANLL